MSRPIKFRVWDKESEKYLLPEKQQFVILPTSPSFGATLPYQSELGADCVDWADADLIAGRYELEQYTGLKDKYGKEIYEGDIVDYCGECTCVVQYEDDGARFIYRDISDDFCFEFEEYIRNLFEVIGNIHEGARGEKE